MSSQRSYDTQAALGIIAQLQDPQWALEAAQIEAEANCEIGAGQEWSARFCQFMANPYSFHQCQRLRSLVMGEFRRLLADSNLGMGTDAAWAIGQERLVQHLQHPRPEIQAHLKSVLAADLSTAKEEPLSLEAQALLQQAVYAALTAEDWDAIAIAAANAIQKYITQHLKLPQSA